MKHYEENLVCFKSGSTMLFSPLQQRGALFIHQNQIHMVFTQTKNVKFSYFSDYQRISQNTYTTYLEVRHEYLMKFVHDEVCT